MQKISTDDEIICSKNYNRRILTDLNILANPIEKYQLKFLTFRRLYDDGRLLHFANDLAWLDYTYDNHIWQSLSSMERILKTPTDGQYAYIWPAIAQDYVYEALRAHNLWNGITIYDKREKYVDMWAFAADIENMGVLNLYLNELTILKQFIMYLHDKARSLFFPKSCDVYIYTGEEVSLNPAQASEATDSNERFNIKKYYYGNDKQSYLTKMEFLCLYHLSSGKSYKTISKILGIAPRTVEAYINSIKIKSQCAFKEAILEKYKYLINMHK